MIKEQDNELIEKDYFEDLQEIKEAIRTNQNKAMVMVNSTMIMTYYEIGTIINKRKTWGSKYIKNLANDLKEYGKGYSTQNLKYMTKFAKEFSTDEFGQQLADKLIPWYTLVEILYKSSSHEEMLWYINETYKNGWSSNQVELQFKAKAYQRYLIKPDTSIQKEDILINNHLEEIVKDSYVLDFIQVSDLESERKLQNSLISNIQKFIL